MKNIVTTAVCMLALLAGSVAQGQDFTNIQAGLQGVSSSSVAWGDFDNDDDLDLLLTGFVSQIPGAPPFSISKIYRNDDGAFTDIEADLFGVSKGSVAWGDYDNDGDVDILLNGAGGTIAMGTRGVTWIYGNDEGAFSRHVAGRALDGLNESAVAWGDYDNDGDLDILLSGGPEIQDQATNVFTEISSKIYRNDGGSVFTDIEAGLMDLELSAAAWGDFDNDGDLDILLTGQDTRSDKFSKIYRNEGGAFTDIEADLFGVSKGSVAWGDYDNDGDLDILMIGAETAVASRGAKIYRNDDGAFTDIEAALTRAKDGSVSWGDVDNDGDLDIVLTGQGVDAQGLLFDTAQIYRNNGDGAFTDIEAGLAGVSLSDAALGDYDDDGDLDLLVTGQDSQDMVTAAVYRNDAAQANTPPSAPTNLTASVADTRAVLRWGPPDTDDETPTAALTYNLRIGTTIGGSEVMSAMAGADGHRLVAQMGNVQHNTEWVINGLEALITYYWSVQAVDHGFAGSAFAEGSFTTSAVGTATEPEEVPVGFTLAQNYPNPFNPATRIGFTLPQAQHVTLTVYDLLGRPVATLVDGRKPAGQHEAVFDARALTSGVYVYRLQAEHFSRVKVMTLLK